MFIHVVDVGVTVCHGDVNTGTARAEVPRHVITDTSDNLSGARSKYEQLKLNAIVYNINN